MSNIGLMEGAFFVGRKEIMEFVNGTLELNLAKVEDTASGACACQLFDIMYPGQVPMHKVNWSAKQDFEYVANYKILQTAFTKQGIERHIDVDRLISGRYMDNLEFLQWFKAFFERGSSDRGDYDANAQRSKGKGGAAFGGGNAKASAVPQRTATTKPVAVPRASIKKSISDDRPEKTKENAAPLRPTRQPSATAAASVSNSTELKVDVSKYLVEIQAVKKQNSEAVATIEEMRGEMDGLEKERDFYFEKLRDIEVLMQELEDKGQGTELSAAVFKILYATVDGFEAVSEEAAAAAVSEEAVSTDRAEPIFIGDAF